MNPNLLVITQSFGAGTITNMARGSNGGFTIMSTKLSKYQYLMHLCGKKTKRPKLDDNQLIIKKQILS